ncbi:MAG: hypothetical protein Q7S02_00065 [bacterium]|nr:hypothetical protein [bacterium]
MATSMAEFLQKQEEVYARFRHTIETVTREGFNPDPTFMEERGGLFVVFRYPHAVTESLARIAQSFAAQLPTGAAFAYDATTIHTTLSDYQVAAGYKPAEALGIVETFNAFARGVRNVVERSPHAARSCAVQFREMLWNRTTAIAAGIPNEEWFRFVQEILRQWEERGVTLRHPWGAHATLARIVRDVPSEACTGLGELPRALNLIATPDAIDVGWFTSTRETFTRGVHETILL